MVLMRLILILALTLVPGTLGAQERPGWIGVSVNIVTAGDGSDLRTAAVVTDVQPGSPAARASIRPGDALLEVNDMQGADALRNLAERLRLAVGDSVRIVLRRGDRAREIRIAAAERPTLTPPPDPRPWIGPDTDSIVTSIVRAMDSTRARLHQQGEQLRADRRPDAPAPPPRSEDDRPEVRARLEASGAFSPLTPYLLGRNRVAGAEVIDVRPGLARYFGVSGGVLVVEAPEGTPAAAAGLRAGDVIVRAEGREVRSLEDLRVALSTARGSASFSLIRHGERIGITLPR